MHCLSALALSSAVALFPQETPSPEPAGRALPELSTPRMACPVAPIVARLPAGGEAYHDLNVPPGEWLLRVSSAETSPYVSLQIPEGEDANEAENSFLYSMVNSVRLSARKGTSVRLRLSASAEDEGALYTVSVHPVRPRPRWKLHSEQGLELHPSFTLPTLAGPRCAAPVTATLRAGTRYRVSVNCDTTDVRVVVPAQNGLRAQLHDDWTEMAFDEEFEDPGRLCDSRQSFVAPRDGLYVFWCIADTADFRARATCRIEQSRLDEERLFPKQIAWYGPDRDGEERSVVLWHRPDLWLVPKDPAVFVPIPAQKPAQLIFASDETQAEYVIRSAAGVDFPVHVTPQSRESYTLTLLEGEPGVWLASQGADGPVAFHVSTPLGQRPPEVSSSRVLLLELPAILRGSVKAGARASVVVHGGGSSPQIAMRGAGILAQCTDPTGFSMLATTEGLATRAGEVEVLITAAGAEPGAIACVSISGFEAQPVGEGVSLELAELQWLSTPGRTVVETQGDWSEEDERLPSGTRVDWLRVPMEAGHVYRILAGADSTPDLILDVPGSSRRSAAGGVAILRPAKSGDATVGLAAPGVDARGAYAVQVVDLGPEIEDAAPAAELRR